MTNPLSVEELDILDEDGPACIRMSDWNRLIAAARKGTLSLTANDVALAFFGVAHMINFWKQQHKSDYTREELAKCEALATKLNAISDHLAPPGKAEATQATVMGEVRVGTDARYGLPSGIFGVPQDVAASPSEDRGECEHRAVRSPDQGETWVCDICGKEIYGDADPYEGQTLAGEPFRPSNTGEVERTVKRLMTFHAEIVKSDGGESEQMRMIREAASLLSSISEDRDWWRHLHKQDTEILARDLTEAKADNERLRASADIYAGLFMKWCKKAIKAQGEIERLREALQEFYDFPHRGDINRKVARAALAGGAHDK